MSFEDRVAIVTGGTGALGREVVLNLLESRARVAVPYRSDDEWKRLKEAAGSSAHRPTSNA